MTGRVSALARMAIPAGALCACALIEPRQPPGWIVCPFRLLTGLPCPMCGMTRGLASLLRGRWTDAVGFHLLSPVVLVALVAWMVVEAGQLFRFWNAHPLGQMVLKPVPWLAFVGVCTVYGALRWCGLAGAV